MDLDVAENVTFVNKGLPDFTLFKIDENGQEVAIAELASDAKIELVDAVHAQQWFMALEGIATFPLQSPPTLLKCLKSLAC